MYKEIPEREGFTNELCAQSIYNEILAHSGR